MARYTRRPGDLVVIREADDSLREYGVQEGDIGLVIDQHGNGDLGIAFEACEYTDWYVDWHGLDTWTGPVSDELKLRAVKARLAWAAGGGDG